MKLNEVSDQPTNITRLDETAALIEAIDPTEWKEATLEEMLRLVDEVCDKANERKRQTQLRRKQFRKEKRREQQQTKD